MACDSVTARVDGYLFSDIIGYFFTLHLKLQKYVSDLKAFCENLHDEDRET